MSMLKRSGIQLRWPNWGRGQRKSANDIDSVLTKASSVDDDSSIELIEECPLESQASSKSVADCTECPSEKDVANDSSDADTATPTPERSDANDRIDSLIQIILDDFRPGKGDQKILRAIGRTASVNAAVLLTAATGGAAAAAGVGLGVGGAITAKRAADGIIQKDEKEVVKSLSVYGAATGASIGAQAITGAILLGCGAALPVVAAVAFGAGCASGITAGALSEWTVEGVIDKMKRNKTEAASNMERSKSDGALSSISRQRKEMKESNSLKHPSRDIPIFRNSRTQKNIKVPKRIGHRRSRSDTIIKDFDKWYQQRNALPRRRRNSCIF
ncbi:hypothetical protein ACHAXN_007677 [Cyclotella atomus]